jgi:serine protease
MGFPDNAQDQHVRRLAQATPYGIDMVNAPQFWEAAGTKGAGVKVCVIDTGFDITHQDLQLTGGVDGYYEYNLNTIWSSDGHGHGTHCAGTIMAQDNDLGVVGVAPDVSLYIVKVFSDSGGWVWSSSIVNAVYKCRDNGADIVSMSLGGSGSSSTESAAFQQLRDVDDILAIAAAGNDGNNALSYPASYDAVVSVAAVDSNKFKASFSQYNSQVELAAPGVSVRSTLPGNSYAYWSGTSMATPVCLFIRNLFVFIISVS